MPDIDWCQRAMDLRAKRDDIVTGAGVASITTIDGKSISYTKADMAGLERLIAEADRKCAEANGQCRLRYARGARFRPY